jgi:hypothetical protein
MCDCRWLLLALLLVWPSHCDDVVRRDSFGMPLFGAARHFALVVGVLSAPGNADERQACRATWFRLAPAGDDVLFMFAIGASGDDAVDARVRAEQQQHGDVLLLPLRESYRRLVFKTAALYDYVAQRRDVSFDFLLKTDDDSFVRLDRLLPLLRGVREPAVYWGSHNTNVKRQSSPAHKWADPLWREDVYPPYALGSAYALSSDLVQKLASLSIDNRPMFPVEDVATGIWLRNVVGEAQLRRVHADSKQFPLIVTGSAVGVCERDMIVRRHCDDVALMRRLYSNVRECDGDACCGMAQM